MAHFTKEEEARRAGMLYAYDIAKKGGMEALEEEIKRRCIKMAPLACKQQDVDAFVDETKQRCTCSIMLVMCMVLRDQYQFGAKRMAEFIARFMEKTEVILEEYVDWQDYIDIIRTETGLVFEFDKSGMIKFIGLDPKSKTNEFKVKAI